MKILSSISLKEIDMAMSRLTVFSGINKSTRTNLYNRAQDRLSNAININFMTTDVAVTDNTIDITLPDGISDFIFRYKPSNSNNLKESIYTLEVIESMMLNNKSVQKLTKEEKLFVYNLASQRVMNIVNKTESGYNLRTDIKPTSSVMSKTELQSHLTFMYKIMGGVLTKSFSYGLSSAISAVIKDYGVEESTTNFTLTSKFIVKIFGVLLREIVTTPDITIDYFVKAVLKQDSEFTGELNVIYKIFELALISNLTGLEMESVFKVHVRSNPSLTIYPPFPIDSTIGYINLGAI